MRRRIEIERFVFQTSQRGRIEVERFIPQHLVFRLGIKFCLRYIYPKVHKTENGLLMERSWYVIGPLLVRELYVNVR